MPGRTTSDNKFAITSYIVGTTLGDGCNYTLIQDAINDIAAAGGIGTIYLRPGSYTENLSFVSSGAPLHIDIVGASTDGRIPSPLSTVNLIGSHTIGGDNLTIAFFQDIAMDAGALDGFTINPTAAQSILALQECSLVSSAGRGAALNPTVGAIAQFSTQDSQINTELACGEILADGAIITSIRGSFASNTSSAFIVGGSGGCQIDGSQVSGADHGFDITSISASIFANNAIISSANACYSTPVGGGQVEAYGCIHTSADPSGYFITGSSPFIYSNITQTGLAIGIDPLMTATPQDWKPYAVEATAPGTGFSRGTACFDDTQFSVVDGFVELSGTATISSVPTDSGTAIPAAGVLNILGGPGVTTSAVGNTVTINSVVWTDHSVNTTVTADSGSFKFSGAGSTTLMLPAAPAQGEECRFIVAAANTLIVQAQGAHTIQIGTIISSAGGTATSSAQGDALYLVFRGGAQNRWWALSVIGNWTLA